MQLGLVTHPIDESYKVEDGEYIKLSLVDYKASSPEDMVTISWTRLEGDNWRSPVIHSYNGKLKHMGTVSKILAIIVRLKEKHAKVLAEPVNLIRELKKKLARHVVWNGKEFDIVRERKTNISKYKPSQEDLVSYTVSDTNEETARIALVKLISTTAITENGLANSLCDWINQGAPLIKMQNNNEDVTPLSVYSRNGK